MKKVIFIAFCVLLIGCSQKHKSAKEIYSSGKVNNLNDFIRIDTSTNDNDPSTDVYLYKYDTAFRLERTFNYYYSTQKRTTFRNWAFIYKGKQVGKCIIYNPDGTVMNTLYFDDNGTLIKREEGVGYNASWDKDGELGNTAK
jgi:hypothetical protein